MLGEGRPWDSLLKLQNIGGFPGGAVVENLPANAGDTGSSPGLGGSHVPWSSWAREPQLLSLRVWSLCSTTRETAMVRGPRTAMKSGPHLPQLEKALAQKRRPNVAINQSINQSINLKKKKNYIISTATPYAESSSVWVALTCLNSQIPSVSECYTLTPS